MKKIPWSESIWFFDIDDTLVNTDTATPLASEGINRVISSYLGKETGDKVQKRFLEIFHLMITGYRERKPEDVDPKYQEMLAYIDSCEKEIIKQFGSDKKWSREVFVKKAADDLGIKLEPAVITEAVNAYWDEMSFKNQVLPGVIELIKIIRTHGRPIFLLTGSDARLTMREDGQFIYDPLYSEKMKTQRVEKLKEKGVDFDTVSVGDPEDKPHLDFFEKGVRVAEEFLKKKIDLGNSLMFGDSFSWDLETPKKMGFGLLVLIEKNRQNVEIHDNEIDTGDILKVSDFVL